MPDTGEAVRIINARIPEAERARFPRYYEMVKYIGGSWINMYEYCPYQLYLWRVKKVEAPKTQAMVAGTEQHKKLEIIHEASVEEELGIEDALTKASFERVGFRYREVHVIAKFEKFQIGGYIDELLILPDSVVIVDDKPGRDVPEEWREKAYRGALLQTFSYALALEKMYSIRRPLRVMIRNRDTGEKIISRDFSDEWRKDLSSTLHEIYLLLKDVQSPVISPSENRCRKCSYRDYCEYYQDMFADD